MTVNLQPEPRHQEPNQTRRGLLKMLAAGTAAAFIPSSHGVLMPVREIFKPRPGFVDCYQPVDMEIGDVVAVYREGFQMAIPERPPLFVVKRGSHG